ncbi:MAG: helix-turn-helix domain-containing protein [Streptosporangiales bacterium]|nr:helix-turn-helix domain-containing protein [Streptosporangiales bacterium]
MPRNLCKDLLAKVPLHSILGIGGEQDDELRHRGAGEDRPAARGGRQRASRRARHEGPQGRAALRQGAHPTGDGEAARRMSGDGEPAAGEERTYPRGFDPERDVLLDARSLRGIAHPLRNQLLGLLRHEGPSTATKLAQRLGLSSAATSYHLRQLAEYGFVVEDEGRGKTRERWWKSAHRSTWFDRSMLTSDADDEGETDALAEEYLRGVADKYIETIRAHVAESPSMPVEWQQVGNMSDVLLALTPDDATRLVEEIQDVIRRYPRYDATRVPTDGRPVSLQYQLMPRTIRPAADQESGPGDGDGDGDEEA